MNKGRNSGITLCYYREDKLQGSISHRKNKQKFAKHEMGEKGRGIGHKL